MFSRVYLAAVAAWTLTLGAAQAAPLEAYGRLPSIEDVRIAPAGEKLASTGAVGNTRIITIVDLGPNPDPLVLKVGDAKLRSLDWIDDDHLLFTVSVTAGAPMGYHGPRREFLVGYVYDLNKHKLNELTPRFGLEALLGLPRIFEVDGHMKVAFANQVLNTSGPSIMLNVYDVGSGYSTQSTSALPLPPKVGVSPGKGPVVESRTGLTIGFSSAIDRTVYRFLDPTFQASWTAILKAFPSDQVDFVSASADRKKIVIKVFGPKTGAAFLLVDVASGHADMVGELYSAVAAADVAPMQMISYTTADGLQLRAYLTLPPGRPAKNLPLILLAHGGPDDRDTWGFDWLVQALAARGYAVLQPQFRGSLGFEPDLRVKGFGEWGRKMQTDLSDGVSDLASKGVADPRRVCIMGASYGGYAALAGVTLQTQIYRCAVSVSGISDPKSMLQWLRRNAFNEAQAALFEQYIGAQDARDAKLTQISPLNAAARTSAPILLIHGDDDTVVPIDQSRTMASALQGAGKPVQLLVLNHEDHWLSRSETRLQMLQATVEFLQAYNPPDAAVN